MFAHMYRVLNKCSKLILKLNVQIEIDLQDDFFKPSQFMI